MQTGRLRTLVITTVVLVIAATSVFAAGDGEAADGDDGSTLSVEDREALLEHGELEWTLQTDPIEFSAFVDYGGWANPWDGWGTDEITPIISELTGVSVEVSTASTSGGEELMAMLATGDLPDFIVFGGEETTRAMLWQQEFVYALDELIDRYAPRTWDIMPDQLPQLWAEADGSFYYMPGYYSDIERIESVPGVQKTISGVVFNMPIYEAMGAPAYESLEDYRQLLLDVKERYPSLPYYAFDQEPESPEDDRRNMAQLINRIYGGGPVRRIADDHTVYMNFRDESYLNAVVFINRLYRDGLFNPENFTLKGNDGERVIRNGEIFSAWGQPFNTYRYDMSEAGIYKPVIPPSAPGFETHWRAATTGIGGWPTAAITTSTSNVERAMLYFQFLLSDEGQMLTYHGIEGRHYTLADDMPKMTPETAEVYNDDFGEFQRQLGIINYQICWFPMNHTDMLLYYWLNQDSPANMIDAEINNRFARNERINELIQVVPGSEEKAMETRIMELWKTSLPLLYLAESEQDARDAYDEFLKQAERLGLAEVEAAYTESYLKWSALLGE